MKIRSFLHEDTETYTLVLVDNMSGLCAIIDPVLDYDALSLTDCKVYRLIPFTPFSTY